jgi:hypothetical protein
MATNGMGTEAKLRQLDDRVERMELSLEAMRDRLESRVDAVLDALGSPPNRALGMRGKGLMGAVERLLDESAQRDRESRERTRRLVAWEKRFNLFVSTIGVVAAAVTIYFYATGKGR